MLCRVRRSVWKLTGAGADRRATHVPFGPYLGTAYAVLEYHGIRSTFSHAESSCMHAMVQHACRNTAVRTTAVLKFSTRVLDLVPWVLEETHASTY
jgi:hypothetical protein